jgi:hypothetical protein
MCSLPIKRIVSPDSRYEVRLTPAGGNPWDLTYTSLCLAGLPFGDRMFGWHGVWSACSRYFAIREWRSSEFSLGPDTHLVVIDVHAGKECIMDRAENGFVEPMSFHNDTIRYSKILYGMPERTMQERQFAGKTAWRDVSGTLPDASETDGQG